MTTYTIKPIEWREGKAFVSKLFIGLIIEFQDGEIRGQLVLLNEQSTKFASLDEAKSFIETSYREFVEQFLEKQ